MLPGYVVHDLTSESTRSHSNGRGNSVDLSNKSQSMLQQHHDHMGRTGLWCFVGDMTGRLP